MKRILQKSKDDNRDPYLPLLEYRNTPLKCGYSPAQLLMDRRLRSILPSTNKQLMPETVDPNKAHKKMTEQQNKTKQHYDKTARKLPPLKVGEPMHIQRDKYWEPAKVVSQHNEHFFKVRTPEGATYRRNRKFLDKTPQLTFSQDSPTTQIRTAPLNDLPSSTEATPSKVQIKSNQFYWYKVQSQDCHQSHVYSYTRTITDIIQVQILSSMRQ